SGGESGGDSGGDEGTDCSDSTYADLVLCTSWMRNDTETAAIIATDGSDNLVDVQSVSVTSADGSDYISITSGGVPSYTISFTAEMIAALEARPNASTDFAGAGPTVSVGDTVDFGADIGFNSTGCTRGETDEGAGFWPPGPECPEFIDRTIVLPVEASEATEDCYTPAGLSGVMVNGVSIFNWTDGAHYNNEGVWYNIAQKFEAYDFSVCGGHAAQGEYHHHNVAPCLGIQLDDDGSEHSPIYGWAPDGVPLHGPYVSNGSLAESCWQTRDYSATSESGCGETGARTCLLVDNTDLSQGTVSAGSSGPTTSETVTSQSGNTFTAESGFYFQDYYFDATCVDGDLTRMDIHNGHSHDDHGYHYHMTTGFPFTYGPTFYGKLHENAAIECQSDPYMSMGGGGPPSL
ncbi:MAG TPA: hypothetical protein DFR83_10575, partial [Deltaproteobacteria bacterium]|nr:hypothetical protein [Deltaproteobacteria bacterium]